MLAASPSLTLPDLIAIALAVGLPLLLTVALCWPKVAWRTAKTRFSSGHAPGIRPGSAPLGLAGQWARHERRIAAGIERQTAAAKLHRQVALQIGALDYEIDRLWRETRALQSAGAGRASISSIYPSTYTRRPSAPGYAAYRLAADARHPEAMAS